MGKQLTIDDLKNNPKNIRFNKFCKLLEKSLNICKIAIDLWLQIAKKENRDILLPHGKELLNVFYKKAFDL